MWFYYAAVAMIPLAAETAPHFLSLAAVIVAATVVGVVTARVARERMVARTDRRRHRLALDSDKRIRDADRATEAQATRGAARIWHTRFLSAAESIRILRQAGEWTAPLSVPPGLLADDMKRVAGSLQTSDWLKVERAEVALATVVARQRVRLGAQPHESGARAAWTAADDALADSALAALGDARDALAPLAEIDTVAFEPTVWATTETVGHNRITRLTGKHRRRQPTQRPCGTVTGRVCRRLRPVYAVSSGQATVSA